MFRFNNFAPLFVRAGITPKPGFSRPVLMAAPEDGRLDVRIRT